VLPTVVALNGSEATGGGLRRMVLKLGVSCHCPSLEKEPPTRPSPFKGEDRRGMGYIPATLPSTYVACAAFACFPSDRTNSTRYQRASGGTTRSRTGSCPTPVSILRSRSPSRYPATFGALRSAGVGM
jgi:hypothetical protein